MGGEMNMWRPYPVMHSNVRQTQMCVIRIYHEMLWEMSVKFGSSYGKHLAVDIRIKKKVHANQVRQFWQCIVWIVIWRKKMGAL